MLPLVRTLACEDREEELTFADGVRAYYEQFMSEGAAEIGRRHYSYGLCRTEAEAARNDREPRTWMNPLESRLPDAPEMVIYSFYGVGKDSERGFVFKPTTEHKSIQMMIDVDGLEQTVHLQKGCYRLDGDGTIPLLSLGFLGAGGWRALEHLNPARIRTVVKEYMHDIANIRLMDVRGGPRTGDHVDILGNHDLTFDFLRIVCDFPEPAAPEGSILQDRFLSNIEDISAAILNKL